MAHHRLARLNRGLLGMIGVLLVLTATLGLLTSVGMFQRIMPVPDPDHTVVIPGAGVQWWVPYAALLAAVVLGLCFARWALAQALPAPSHRTWRLPAPQPHRGLTYLSTRAAADALAADVRAYPGVTHAAATITGHRLSPRLVLEVATETHAPLAPLRRTVVEHALPRLRHALELDSLPTELVLRLDAAVARRSR